MQVVSDNDKSTQTFIYGFEDTKAKNEKREKVIRSLLTSLLIHETIFLALHDFRQIIDYIGPEDASLLLSDKCIKIIKDQLTEPVIVVGENNFSFSAISRIGDEVERFEKSLIKVPFNSETEKQRFILNTEDSLVKCDDKKLRDLIQQEISSDLRNVNIKEELGIRSSSAEEVSQYDIYKLLRLANISKGLIYQSEYDISTTTVDGYASKYLQSKLSHFSKKVSSKSDDTFLKVLDIKGIPDLSVLYQKKIMTMHEILNMRESYSGKIFRHWYSSIDYDQDQFLRQLTSSKKDGTVKKLFRWILPNAIGIFSPVAGVAASAIDSYIIEKVISGWQPNIFLDDILREEINNKIDQHERKTRKEEISKRFGKIGRNEMCPCNSGKKLKKCCGKG